MSDLSRRLAELSPEKRKLLEARLRLQQGEGARTAVRPRGAASGPVPLSFAQERLWVLEQLGTAVGVYTMPYALRLRGRLDADALRRALEELVRRHEALRTVFAARDGAPVQVVLPAPPLALPVEEVEGEEGARRAAAEEALRPFDLERGPLLRARRLRLRADAHLLLLVMHHAVSDAWSLDVLFREVCALYDAFVRGGPSPLAPLPVQYADYAAWQREQVSGAVLEEHLAFWRRELAGVPPVLDLPADRPRSPVQRFRGGRHHFPLPTALVERLREVAREEEATLYTVLLAGFQLLLARWSGEDAFVVGTPVTHRTRPELQALVGFFVNTLALRADLSGDPGFRELVRRVRRGTLAAFAHQDAPFDRVVEAVNPERDPSRSPLVQAMFSLRGALPAPHRGPELEVALEEGETGTAMFDLTLEVMEAQGGASAVLEYDADLFEPGTVLRMAEHFRLLLESAAAAPDRPLSELSLLSADERRRIESWTATAPPHPRGAPVHERVAAQARRRPQAVAVVSGAGRLTYGELLARADHLAADLRRRGVGPETVVGVRLGRSPELVVALLAVLRAGGAYLPIDPATPPERVELMLRDAGVEVVLDAPHPRPLPHKGGGEHDNDSSAEEGGAAPGRANEFAATTAQSPPSRTELPDASMEMPLPRNGGGWRARGEPGGGVSPDSLAYVIYTSGSTGTPKGVLVTHGGLTNLVGWHLEAFGVTEADRATQLAGLGFDASVWEVWPYLAAGATLHLVDDEETRASPAALQAVLLEERITVAFAPTPLAEGMLGLEWPADAPLRTLLTGGDALRGRPRPGLPFALVNAYGPTENTVVATSGEVAAAEDGAAPSIGRPVDGVRAYVLDRAGRHAPVGVPGELYVGGAGVARGYLGRPELTAERFVPDALSPEPGARAYRTGDRARWRTDGTLEFLGRTDRQLKVRGFRVEPGEVEAALRAHPAVADAVADAPGGARLVAWVVPREGETVEEDALRAHLRERLPEYMVPAALVFLHALPLTPSGKVDRRALPAPAAGPAESGTPRTPAEQVLWGVWSEVLGRAPSGVRDNFFALGGHSLLAARVASRVRRLFGVELPMRALFEAPTVAALAERIEAARREGAGVALPPLLPSGRTGPLPLSFAQERLWLMEQMQPGEGVYTIPVAVRLRGALDVRALERALDDLVRRHEALRTVFFREEGGPAQTVLPHAPRALPVEELSGGGDALARRMREEALRPFDLGRGPLFRAALLRTGEAEHVLVLALHHVVGDGWSMDVLFRELGLAYAARAAGEVPALPDLPVRYADFAVWQREWLRGETLDRLLAPATARLDGAPTVLELPADRPRPAAQSFRGALHHFVLAPDAAEGVKALAAREGATPFMALLAAFQLLLARYAGVDDLLVGTPVAGRTHEALEGLVGFFVNTLVLRAELSEDMPFAELLARTREAALAAHLHADLPFERLVEAMGVERSLSHAPLVQAVFTHRAAPTAAPAMPGLAADVEEIPTGTAKFDLSLELTEDEGELRGALEYAADLFDASTAERMAGHFRTLVEGIAARPEGRLSELSLLSPEERRTVLADAPMSVTHSPLDEPVHERVRARAERAPAAVAIVSGDRRLTYGELDGRADLLAAGLRRRGVGPETVVGVCLGRSPELVVALLAVLRAGGAYLPVDPSTPRERIAFMLRNAGVALVLADEGNREAVGEVVGEVVVVTPHPPAPSPTRGEGENDSVEYGFGAPGGTPHPRPLPHKGGGEHDHDSSAEEREAAPGRANEFAATTAQSPPSRTEDSHEKALPRNWGRVASPSEPGGGAVTDASLVSLEHPAVLPSPLVGEGPGVGGKPGAPTPTLSPDSLAYVIYTSGSTGTPKGVLVTHGGLANLVGWHLEAFGVTEGDRATQLAGLGFDASVWEIWPYLVAGATLHLVDDEETRASPAALRDFLLEHGITVAFAPTPVAEGMLGLEWPADAPLRTLLTGGDALRSWPAPGLPFALVNNYGPTENTVVATSGEVAPGGTARAPGIGRAVAGVRAYVLDGALEPAPAGVPGELYLGGAGVARGYLGDPASTAAKFVPDPFSPEPGARLYRTGDRARRAADGALDFLGRTDAQVKVRGFRVEPGEVEAVLLRHPGVREAAVVARRDAPGGTRLAAYVVPGERGPSADELRAHARGLLPEYMVPSAWVFLPSLPLTPSGKTDRRALPAPVYEAAPASPAPRTPAEDLLAGIWGEVLGVGGVGTRDDFFALGGHSLLATQVVSRVRRAFGVELPLRALFEAPTVEALARRVEAARADGSGVAAPPVTPVGREGPLPLSFAQERLWFLEQMRPGEGAYTIPVALRLTGSLSLDALERAVGELVRRHEALRTVFPARGGRPVQVVRPVEPVALPVEPSADVPGLVREEMLRPFDLEAGPVFRARLARLGADEHLLLLAMHHVVSDGWSVGVLLGELGALYRALAAGEPPSLPGPPVQYGDFAAWQRAHLTDAVLDGQLAYWRSRLAGAPPVLEIPADRPRPPLPSFRGASHAFALPPELAERVRAAGRAAGATPFMLLLAVFQLLLSRYAGEDDVVVGTPVAGRTRAELEGTVGFFANTLALRGDLSGDPTFAELLARVRETTLGAFAHQDLPFERLVEELRPGRDLSRNPLFQVLFVLQNTPAGSLDAGELRISVEPVESTASKFDLTLALEERGGALAATLEYAAELFDPATVERMAAHFGALLEAATADPGRRLSALSFLTPGERALAFAGGNPAPESFAVAGTLHGRFEAMARARPDAVAVTAGAESLTYAELDARADRLAASLRGLGVGPETRVGLCVERSAETVVGILGILKAGGAYVPLDPSYPAERLAYLLEDSGVGVLVAGKGIAGTLPEFGGTVVSVGTPHPRPLPHKGGGEHDEAGARPEEALTPRPPLPMLGEGEHDTVEGEDRSVEMPLPRNGGGWRARGEPGGGAAVSPHNLAYVIYTSGSTGRPKGVTVTHANVLRLFDATEGWFGFGPDDVWTLFHSYAFDFSVWEIWGALLYGGRVVVVPFETSRDPAAFRELLARERVTVLSQTPSAFRQLVHADEKASGPDLALRWVVFGGEALEPGSLRPWTEKHGLERPRLVNMYGITETTVHVTYRPVTGEDVDAGAVSPVGVPLRDLRVHLADRHGSPVPAGVPGEMLVGGAGVARGYLGRPELTAERFVPDPFSLEPGARLYRSGDRARWRADGDLEYLGRIDQQVKVRGFRIEPGEIEAALVDHPSVREAVVLVREDRPGDRRLVAYVVAADGEEPRAGELRSRLAARLPEHMVPAAFVVLDVIPLTSNGKTDRRALPVPEAPAGGAETVAPRSETERTVAGVWREVLELCEVGAHDNFFELGGHSLLLARVHGRLREVLGREVPIVDLFRFPTVSSLARHLVPEEDAGAEEGEGRGRAATRRTLMRRSRDPRKA